jgi:hypothetical protein
MKIKAIAAALTVCMLGVFAGVTLRSQGQPPTDAQRGAGRGTTPEQQQQHAKWMKELSNWGRWGADDELGTLNLITVEKRKQALALAKTGTVVSLERPVLLIDRTAAIKADGKPDGNNFFEITFRTFPPSDRNAGFSSDVQSYAPHGGAYTHLDGLCHQSAEGKRYNGFPMNDTDKDHGCAKLGLQLLRTGIVTRGILIDFPRLKGVSTLPPGTRLRPEDVEAWEKMAGVKIAAGDAVFLYSGWKEGEQGGRAAGGAPAPGGGYDVSVMPLMRARDVALMSGDRGNADHSLALTAIGMYLIDNAGLQSLAETAARLRRWEFLLIVAPVPAPGATGALVNPLAIF